MLWSSIVYLGRYLAVYFYFLLYEVLGLRGKLMQSGVWCPWRFTLGEECEDEPGFQDISEYKEDYDKDKKEYTRKYNGQWQVKW